MNPIFLNNLHFWTWHCLINAFPSFLIAGIYLDYFHSVAATSAMLVGILFFILIYSTIFTVVSRFQNPDSRLNRALALALLFRLILVIFGIIGVMAPLLFLFHPDYYAGLAAFKLQQLSYEFVLGRHIDVEHIDSFFDILLWTILEGTILTLFLIALSLLALLIVTRAKKTSAA